MSASDNNTSSTRIPLVSGAVIAVRSRPWLAYLLAALALAAAAWAWLAVLDERAQLRNGQQKLATLENRFSEAQRQQQRLLDDLTLRGRQLDEVEARLARWDESLNAGQRRIWLVNEADHYIRLAQQHLLLTRDLAGARTLLDVADKLLASHGDSQLLPLREALARDRLALSAALGVDTAGVYLRLAALGERVGALKLGIAASDRPLRLDSEVPAPAVPENASLLDTGWARLRQLVTVRRHDQPVQAVLGEAGQALVREALRLDLAQAQLALLRAEPAVYVASLRAAQARLTRHFQLLPRAELDSLGQELDGLMAVDIRPALPDLATSIGALDALSAREAKTPAALPGKAP